MLQSSAQFSRNAMDVTKRSNRTVLNSLVMRAWRERWTDMQWGIHIKTILPCGVSGDVFNLADCLLQQALVGSTANQLVLTLLKHSLSAQLVSHGAVLRRITTYNFLDRVYCLTTLFEFLDSIMDSVTCRNKQEELMLPNVLVHLVKWFVLIIPVLALRQDHKLNFNADGVELIEQFNSVIKRFADNQFLLSVLYVGRQEDGITYNEICQNYTKFKLKLGHSTYKLLNSHIERNLQTLAYIDISNLKLPVPNFYGSSDVENCVESITYIVQPLLAVDVLLNPTKETVFFVHEMQMIQRLKNFSNARLYYEIIRAGLISLSNMAETNHDTMWGAFTFFKIPQIIKSLHALTPVKESTNEFADYIPEVIDALEMLIEDNLLLDIMDTKCSCNIIEYVLNDWTKHNLVNETQAKNFADQREKTSSMLQKRDTNNPQSPSIINFIIRAEVPLNGILKTLSTDYNKVQEALLGVLCQVLVGNSFDLILSVATVEGRLRTFISRLIQCNENSKQVAGETGKQQAIRSTLFDVSFLMLMFITQTYGPDIVLSANKYAGSSFFEKWVRECMVERNKPKNPVDIINLCDEEMVDELLLTLSKPDAQVKNSLTWEDICMTLPAVLNHVLLAWEHDALTSTDVKSILDNIKRRLFCYSVCATSYLCAYMYSVREHQLLKPLNMIQQFLAPSINEDLSPQDNVKERMALAFLIIRKMQHDVHPSGTFKPRSIALTQSVVSNVPLIETFRDVWKVVMDSGYMSVRSGQMLESLMQAAGPAWMARYLIEEIIRCKYVRDMNKAMDIVFAIMHMDIERCTAALLEEVIPLLMRTRQGDDVNEPQLLVLSNLCAFCIISCVEIQNAESTYGCMRNNLTFDSETDGGGPTSDDTLDVTKKRARTNDTDDMDNRPGSCKLRKIASCEDANLSDDVSNESQLLAEAAASLDSISTAGGEHGAKKNINKKNDESNKGMRGWSLTASECCKDEEASRNSLAEAIASVSGIVSSVDQVSKSLDDVRMETEAGISNMSSATNKAQVTLDMDCVADSNSSAKESFVDVPNNLILEDKTDKAAEASTASNLDNVDGGGVIAKELESDENHVDQNEITASKTPENSVDNAAGGQDAASCAVDKLDQSSGEENDAKNDNGEAVVRGSISVCDRSDVDFNVQVDEIVGETGKLLMDCATLDALEKIQLGVADTTEANLMAATTATTSTIDSVVDAVDGDKVAVVNSEINSSTFVEALDSSDNLTTDVAKSNETDVITAAMAPKIEVSVEIAVNASIVTNIDDGLKETLASSCGIEDISADAVDGNLEKLAESANKDQERKTVSTDNKIDNSVATSITDIVIKPANVTEIDMESPCDVSQEQSSTFLEMGEVGNGVGAELCAAVLEAESMTADLAVDMDTTAASSSTDTQMLVDAELILQGEEGSGDVDTLAHAYAAADAFNLGEEASFGGRLVTLAQLQGDAAPTNNNVKESVSETTNFCLPEDDIPSTSGLSIRNMGSISRSRHNNTTSLQVRRLPTYADELREPLASSLHALFKVFQKFVKSNEFSPKVYFVHQFLTMLVDRGGERVRPVLNLLPATVIPGLLKLLLNENVACGLITRLQNLGTAAGRQAAISDLVLWHTIKLKEESMQL